MFENAEVPHSHLSVIRLPTVLVVDVKYRLQRDTYGFIESTSQIVTIPAGATIVIGIREHTPVGVCNIVWDGKILAALFEDVQRNGSMIWEATTA